jgi:hypothetical protein
LKLIFCKACSDVIRVLFQRRTCICGASWAVLLDKDGLRAEIGGDAVALGISNDSFTRAVKSRPYEGRGYKFHAFVIPKVSSTVTEAK